MAPCMCGDPMCWSCGVAQGTLEEDDEMATRMSRAEDAQAAELFGRGLSYREIAVNMGRSDKSIPAAVARGSAQQTVVPRITARRLARLDDQERLILEHRMGLAGRERLTLQALASMLGLSRQRVYQLERRALEKVRSG